MNATYQFTIPVFTKGLKALEALLSKVETISKEKGMDEAALLEQRLAPDMFPFKKQVQIACDNAKGAGARLSGVEVPKHEDNEASFAELRTRIQKTLAFLETVSEESFTGADERQITLAYFPNVYFTGFDYARDYCLPNFFFHLTTAYAILRKEGFEIGKQDYMGTLPLKPIV